MIPASRSSVVTVLPARGNPVVLDSPGRDKDLLVDCSSSHDADQLVKRFLHGQGFGSIKHLLITHADVNHSGGLPLLRKEFSPSAIFTSAARGRSRAYRNVIEDAGQVPGLVRTLAAGQEFVGGTIFHPRSGGKFPRADDNAIVFRSEIQGWRVLFLSDLGAVGRNALLEQKNDLRCDILLCSPAEASSTELMAAVSPRLMVIGGVQEAPFKHTRARAQQKLAPPAGALSVMTSPEGAVRMELTRDACRVETADAWFVIER